ncbi:hypothetical protein EIP91_012252 [Steccherinum ochraceum]|uniref:Uncharacterized protein n=1 Tax=Steccherinum ochraceum TaxID=92696 RepID=A0A4R0RNF4_9APHY|nr:hypothetical protein EIP91_012252 [Steccherinum ochraceum]
MPEPDTKSELQAPMLFLGEIYKASWKLVFATSGEDDLLTNDALTHSSAETDSTRAKISGIRSSQNLVNRFLPLNILQADISGHRLLSLLNLKQPQALGQL